MTLIRLFRKPVAGGAQVCQEFDAPSIGEWLVTHYPNAAAGNHRVFAWEPAVENELTGNVEALLRNDAAFYTVLETPGTGLEWLVPILINLAVSTVLSFVARSIFAPDKSNLDNRSQESPNNALSDRSNRVRLLERVEDIFGTVRAIPSLMMPTYGKYQGNRRVEFGLYCVTRGYALIEDIRDGDTDLASITGASAEVYGPFTSPNSGTEPQLRIGEAIIDPVLSVRRSGGVEGIILKPANQLELNPAGGYTLRGPGPADASGVPATTEDVIWQPPEDRKPNIASVAEAGQTLHVVMPATEVIRATGTGGSVAVDAATKTYTSSVADIFLNLVDGTPITFAGGFTYPNAETKTVVAHTNASVTVVEADLVDDPGIADVSITMTINLSGDRLISTVGDGYATLAGPAQWGPAQGFGGPFGGGAGFSVTVDNGLSDWTDWNTLSAADMVEVWINVVARQGLYKDDGSKSSISVAYEMQIERLDASLAPTGEVITASSVLEGSTATERAETLERTTGWTGPVRVRVRRTTPYDYDFGGAVVDEITWADLLSVAPVTRTHFGNKTIIHTVTHATQGATAIQRRELNCLASRMLPTYDGAAFSGGFDATGALAWGTIYPTSSMLDILAAVTVDPVIGGRDISELDLAQAWDVQGQLDAWHPEVGQFNYTFDRDELSYEETLLAIADAAFCKPFRQNGQIRLALDRPQDLPVALFTHANKRPKSETVTRRFANDSEYDGIELVYTDPDSEKQETIRLPVDASKYRRVEISGIRSFAQAWLRANREWNRLQFGRLSLETIATADARALLPNSRIDVADNTAFDTWDGEVIAQNGLELTLNREVEFEPGQPHSIVLTRRDGSAQAPIVALPGATADRVILATPPDEAIVSTPTPEDGVRTAFSLASDSGRDAQQWLVQSLALEEGGQYVRIRAVNYAPEYYAADDGPIPARDTVINS